MLTEIRVSNPRRTDLAQLQLPLFGQTSFPIAFVDGLGPPKAELSSSKYSNLDEDHFQSSRVGARNIVLTLELAPSYSINEDAQDLRERLYNYFSPKATVNLEFHTTKGTRYISGVVESCEPPMFVQIPAIQISIMCYDPFYRAGAPTVVSSNVGTGALLNVANNGNVAVGFELKAVMASVGTEFLVSLDGSQERPVHIAYAFPIAKTINVNTNARLKDSKIVTPATSLLPYLVAGSGWPRLQPGPNPLLVRYVDGSGTNNLTVTFTERFSGL